MRQEVEAATDGRILSAVAKRIGCAQHPFGNRLEEFQSLFIQAAGGGGTHFLGFAQLLAEQGLIARLPSHKDALGLQGGGHVQGGLWECHP